MQQDEKQERVKQVENDRISVTVTKHERHLTLGNEQWVVEGEVGGGLR